MTQQIYMDNHATTRVDPRVLDAMLPFFSEQYGNAGSVGHALGHQAGDAVEAARESISEGIGCRPKEIVFTSGATESNNLALRGVADLESRRGRHIISVATEHRAVLDPLDRLARSGFEITLLPVNQTPGETAGLLDLERLKDALRDDTLLVSVMLANNEIGVIQPLAEIGQLCRERGVLLHCDATQAVAKLPVDVEQLQVDLLSFSAHKMYGPKGVGALYVRSRNPRVRLRPQIDGGGQEGGRRSGTLNSPGIVGFARALAICIEEMDTDALRLRRLRDRLFDGLTAALDNVSLNGPALSQPELRLPGNLNVAFAGVDGEALMMNLPGLAVSSGAACTSANPQPSHVLQALGVSDALTRSSLRFGLGRFNTADEVATAVGAVASAVERLRKISGLT